MQYSLAARIARRREALARRLVDLRESQRQVVQDIEDLANEIARLDTDKELAAELAVRYPDEIAAELPKKRAPNSRPTPRRPVPSGRPWTPEEEAAVMAGDPKDDKALAVQLDRKPDSIVKRRRLILRAGRPFAADRTPDSAEVADAERFDEALPQRMDELARVTSPPMSDEQRTDMNRAVQRGTQTINSPRAAEADEPIDADPVAQPDRALASGAHGSGGGGGGGCESRQDRQNNRLTTAAESSDVGAGVIEQLPERAEVDDQERKPPEANLQADDGAGISSETNARLASGGGRRSWAHGEDDGQTRASAAETGGIPAQATPEAAGEPVEPLMHPAWTNAPGPSRSETPGNIEPVNASASILAREAELEALDRFEAEHGVTTCPAPGSAELAALPMLSRAYMGRKWSR